MGGGLAWDLLQRLDDIIALDPEVITVLVGTNDAASNISEIWVKTQSSQKTASASQQGLVSPEPGRDCRPLRGETNAKSRDLHESSVTATDLMSPTREDLVRLVLRTLEEEWRHGECLRNVVPGLLRLTSHAGVVGFL